jgi:hypothetical protein
VAASAENNKELNLEGIVVDVLCCVPVWSVDFLPGSTLKQLKSCSG